MVRAVNTCNTFPEKKEYLEKITTNPKVNSFTVFLNTREAPFLYRELTIFQKTCKSTKHIVYEY